ncbi:nucleotidyltransferase domain-containing protein [Nitrosomonas sp.]|uniref:type VII toxin-antitoxin system MntA family adenylyltransferase antitoxin n=1 Tax=Nitrosomonas sp. TaxID=42353 RepID=UPI0025D126DA|nr:nucleotidyltransferase domain-containing protein [Nitrosomonas sp.]
MSQQETDKIDRQIQSVMDQFSNIRLVIILGSVAIGKASPESDLAIAVLAKKPLSAQNKILLINVLAESTGRPIDLVDLSQAGEPLLGKILQHGRKISEKNQYYAELLSKHLIDQADFVPYQRRILAERRKAWIGK